MIGAWAQKWPAWAVTGALHGVLLGLIGLIGDLTASMIKRDAGVKDYGDLIPEHVSGRSNAQKQISHGVIIKGWNSR